MDCQPELRLRSLTGKITSSHKLLDTLGSHCTVVLVGNRGIGKTTLLQSLLKDYDIPRKDKYDLDLANTVFLELKSKLQACLDEGKCERIICLDSFEKFMRSSKVTELETLLGLARKIPASMCGSVVIATRYSGLNLLYSHLDRVHHHYSVEGFTKEGLQDFINTSFPNSDNISKLLKENTVLQEMCTTPIISKELSLHFSGLKTDASFTDIVTYILLSLVKGEVDQSMRGNVKNFDTLPTEERNGFKVVCKLAFEGLVFGNKFEDVESSSLFLSSFCLKEGITSVGSIKALDLVDFCEDFRYVTDLTKTSFWFMSAHVQDFLCGYYLHNLPPLNQVFFLIQQAKDLIDSGYHCWLRYFYGLTARGTKQFNPTGMMVNSVNELLLHCLDMEKSLHAVIFLNCLVETGEKSYWRKLGSKKDKIFHISLSMSEFKQARKGLIAMVEYSGIKDWILEASESNQKPAADVMAGTKVNVKISQNKILQDDVRLMPRLDTSAAVEDRRYKPQAEGLHKNKSRFNYFSCRALREIMQRVLQLYSKPKLKGDSSNPSYLSFLSCDCLKEAMELHVTFDPVIPLHFLPVLSKVKYVVSENDQTAVHLNEKHNGDATELVIILQPTLRRVTFVLPGTSQKYEIELSTEDLPEELNFESVFGNVDEVEDLVNCCRSQELFPLKCESVFPGLPIPLNHPEIMGGNVVIPETLKSKLGTSLEREKDRDKEQENLMKSREGSSGALDEGGKVAHGISEIGHFGADVENTTEKMSQTQRRKFDRESGVMAVKGSQQEMAGSVGGSLVMPSIDSKSVGKSSSLSSHPSHHYHHQQATKPATAMRPGTVTYSVIQERLSTEQLHSLPDERSPVQVGGNGIILHGDLQGLRVAIKKTAFRTREFNIMMKLNHSNVLRLLAFMWGEENPKHRRHYFAYHFYDLYHGKG